MLPQQTDLREQSKSRYQTSTAEHHKASSVSPLKSLQHKQKPPPSGLFTYNILSLVDEVEKVWEPRYDELKKIIEQSNDDDAKKSLVSRVTKDKNSIVDVILALLYGILVKPEFSQKCYSLLSMVSVSVYAYKTACTELHHVVLHRYPELSQTARQQLLWLLGNFLKDGILEAMPLFRSLLRWTSGGNTSQEKVWLCATLVTILQENKSKLPKAPSLLSHIIYNFLRSLSECLSSEYTELQAIEADFLSQLIRENFEHCLSIGRDFVRVFLDVLRAPQLTALWNLMITNPSSLHPSFTGVEQLFHARTSSSYFLSRVTPRMEHYVRFLLEKVKLGKDDRYYEWIADKYLRSSFEASEALVCDLIRYIVCCLHPSNEQLNSSNVPRWKIISKFLFFVKTKTGMRNAKLSLYYDWLFYSKPEEIMLIEPGALLIQNILQVSPKISVNLLEFLPTIATEFYPPLHGAFSKAISAAFQLCYAKGILSNKKLLEDRHFLGQKLFERFQEIFPDLYSTNAEPVKTASTPGKRPSSSEHEKDVKRFSSQQPEKHIQVGTTVQETCESQLFDKSRTDAKKEKSSSSATVPSNGVSMLIEESRLLIASHESALPCVERLLTAVLNIEDLKREDTLSVAGFLAHVNEEEPQSLWSTPSAEQRAHEEASLELNTSALATYDPLFHILLLKVMRMNPRDMKDAQEKSHYAEGLRVGAGVLHSLSLRHSHIDTCLLHFLYKNELSVEVYKLFAEAQGLSLEDSLWGAVEACGEYQRQFDLLLYVFERVESVQGSVRLLQLLLCCMDSSKLYDVQTRITFGTLSLFNEQTLPVLLACSLDWEMMEVHNLWPLLIAEAYRNSCVVSAVSARLVEFSPEDNKSFFSGALLLFASQEPTVREVKYLLGLPPDHKKFVLSVLLNWLANQSILAQVASEKGQNTLETLSELAALSAGNGPSTI